MKWPMRAAATAAAVAALTAVSAVQATAQNLANDRTEFTFDEPVMVPGATLQPGRYIFKLADTMSNRNIIEILKDDATPVATALAIPTVRSREERTGDVVVLLTPTLGSEPPAVKAWYYPGDLYGHEFIYPENQAKQIAQRTKQLVLSGDTTEQGGQGTLYRYNAEGARQAWQPDDQAMRDWQQWDQERRGQAMVAAPARSEETRESTAPMMKANAQGTKVTIDQLEDEASHYAGKTVTVTGEVDEVFGPRLFKIDEPSWADLDREVLVYLPSNLAALVREDDDVTVTGTVKQLSSNDVGEQLGWLEDETEAEAGLDEDFTSRPAIVANRIVGGDSDVALTIHVPEDGGTQPNANAAANQPAGKSGMAGERGMMREGGMAGAADAYAREPVTDANTVARGDHTMVGRRVKLDNVEVSQVGEHHGFWVVSNGARLFVLPSRHPDDELAQPTAGQHVTIEGTVLALPRSMRDAARAADNGNADIYIYAMTIK